MGTAKEHALGRTRVFYVMEETTYGTFTKPTSGSDCVVLDCTFSPSQERKVRDDARATRSALEQITGKRTATWSIESYVLPRGDASPSSGSDLIPDLEPLIKAALGTAANASTPTRREYTLSAAQDLGSLSLVQKFGDVFMEALAGCYVNSMTVSISGGEEPKFTFEGESSGQYIPTTSSPTVGGQTFATVDGASSDATFNVHSGEGANFKAGSVIDIGADTNQEVVSVSGDSITLGGSLTVADGETVKLSAPAATGSTGSPIAGILGSLSLGGDTMPITSFEVTVNNNIKAISDEAFEQGTSDYVPGFREVTGSLSIRCRSDVAIQIGKQAVFATQAITVTCGDTTGSKFVVSIPAAELEVAAVETPQSDEVVIPLSFKALATGSGENEISMSFQ